MTSKTVPIYLWLAFFGVVINFSEERMSRIRVPKNHGCADGRKHNLFHLRDVSACNGAWEGHVGTSSLCSPGWHVCNWNDTRLLSSITFYRATHVDGCYAINAAQGGDGCQECSGDSNKMAGVGADCPTSDKDVDSCLSSGTITASYDLPGVENQPCSFAPWISGVVCCKDEPKGSPPVITISPTPTVRVPVGSEVSLKCAASGDPAPAITWFKNGYPVVFDGLIDDVSRSDDAVVSSLRIPQSSREHNGLYVCRAENSFGLAVSYSSEVTSYKLHPELTACRNKANQALLFGGAVAACSGRWRGSVKSASKRLCAKGWRVCGLKDRSVLYKLPWGDVTSLSGCYAYDAATSDNFACTSCSHKKKGNRMSGIGSGCGSLNVEAVSCLREGRVDVWRGGFGMKKRSSKSNSCNYVKGVTSGVMCCKSKGKSRKRRKDRPCSTPCGPNRYCSKRGVCKCRSGFKLLRGKCHPRLRKRGKCSKIKCLNGGRCKKGVCICRSSFSGPRCQHVLQIKTLELIENKRGKFSLANWNLV